MTKRRIKDELHRHVISQEEAIDTLSAAAYIHRFRIEHPDTNVKKANVLLYGPSGSGKTYSMNKLAEVINVPISICDASTLTAAGYQGSKPEDFIKALIQEAMGDISAAERGIIYIDEIDKLATLDRGSGTVSTREAQYSLLRVVEGMVVQTPQGPVRTHDMLFIAGGAFAGDPNAGVASLEQILQNRYQERQRIGFEQATNPNPSYGLQAMPKDLVRYGLIKELVGRFPQRVAFQPLSVEDLVLIATTPVNSPVKQLQTLLSAQGVELTITDDALNYIAHEAYNEGMGARSLETYFSRLRNSLLDEIDTCESIVINRNKAEEIMIRPWKRHDYEAQTITC